MGFKKQAIAALSVVSLLAASVSLTNFASARWSDGDSGSWISTPVACSEAQYAINNATDSLMNGYNEVRIAEDCAANLTIPSGKKIVLSLYSEYDDEYGNKQQRYHTLRNSGENDTITVENGAALFLMGPPSYEGFSDSTPTVINDANGKSAIRNYGTVRIGANLTAENEAHLTMSSGKLYTVSGFYANGDFINVDGGKTYLAMGTFNNVGNIQPYIVNGMKLDGTTGKIVSALPDGANPLSELYSSLSFYEKRLPVGYSFSVGKIDYADYADAFELLVTGSNDVGSPLIVTGSNQEGWTLSVVGVGHACVGVQTLQSSGSDGCLIGYVAPSDAIDTAESLTKYLVNKFFELIRQAVEDGKAISLDTNARVLTGASVEAEKAIWGIIGNDTLADYYDVNLVLNADGEKITDIHDLENEEMEVRLPADFLGNLQPVKSGYKRNFYVVRYHEGAAEKLPATLDNNEIVFKSGKFSTYAVAYNDTKITTGGSTSGNSSTGTSNSGSSNSNISNSSNGSNGTNASGSSNSTNSSNSNTGVSAPDTGVATSLGNGGATVTIVSAVVVLAIASGVYTYKAVSRKQGREK